METLKVNLNELLLSFSLLLDVAENRHFQHAKRVAYITLDILNKMNKEDLVQEGFQAAILHDIGVTHSILLHGRNAFNKAETIHMDLHTNTGYEIVKELPFGNRIADYVKYHHEHWDGSGPSKIAGNDIPLISQIISLADYIDLQFNPGMDSVIYRNEIRSMLIKEKGRLFNDTLVDLMLESLEKEKLWLDLGLYDINELLKTLIPEQAVHIGIEELEQIAKAFSVIIDKKSAFTYEHSSKVADRCYRMAIAFGYDNIKRRKFKIAGYLHDIGKLIVPNNILDKPDKLTKEEMLIIKKHPYYSKFILRQIKGFEEISEWGPNHHENLKGTGYPEGIGRDKLTEECQIMALCDIYQALTEDRIYRSGMSHEEAIKILERMVNNGYYEAYIFEQFSQLN